MLVTQHGCDSHVLDPLAHLALTLDAQRASYAALHDLAHEYAGGRWVALGGGGYEVVDVVPRAWAHLVGIAAHRPVEPGNAVPQGWRDYVRERVGRPGPARMTDGRDVDRAWRAGTTRATGRPGRHGDPARCSRCTASIRVRLIAGGPAGRHVADGHGLAVWYPADPSPGLRPERRCCSGGTPVPGAAERRCRPARRASSRHKAPRVSERDLRRPPVGDRSR